MQLYQLISGAGPTLMLIHGIISDHSYFDALAPYLEKRFRVVRYDRRGYGLDGSFPDGGDCSLQAQIADAADILSAETEPSFIVAHSAGCLVALGLAQRNPDAVRGLILIEPALGCDAADRPLLDAFHRKVSGLAAQGKYLQALAAITQAGGHGRQKKPAAGAPDSLTRMKRNLNHFMSGEMRELFAFQADPAALGKMSVPVFVGISDSPDSLFASVSRHDAALLGWPTFRLPEGHDCLRTEPAVSAETLIGLIDPLLHDDRRA